MRRNAARGVESPPPRLRLRCARASSVRRASAICTLKPAEHLRRGSVSLTAMASSSSMCASTSSATTAAADLAPLTGDTCTRLLSLYNASVATTSLHLSDSDPARTTTSPVLGSLPPPFGSPRPSWAGVANNLLKAVSCRTLFDEEQTYGVRTEAATSVLLEIIKEGYEGVPWSKKTPLRVLVTFTTCSYGENTHQAGVHLNVCDA